MAPCGVVVILECLTDAEFLGGAADTCCKLALDEASGSGHSDRYTESLSRYSEMTSLASEREERLLAK